MSTSSPEQSARLTKHVRKIARYEGITEGQGQVLLAAADAFEASLAEVEALESRTKMMEMLITRANDRYERSAYEGASFSVATDMYIILAFLSGTAVGGETR